MRLWTWSHLLKRQKLDPPCSWTVRAAMATQRIRRRSQTNQRSSPLMQQFQCLM
ncbi:hypothetical protein DPMN_125626 [Dreissena polymorpha]|uniref:Uncharacterized protein n=1 Tax=Dreissena polymorpha TaxID=45954 RepID=A0A9D4JUW3_DREPO|nr:hypothetical protein DPMN_125626 [Dreissena polymorpha]